MLSERLRNALKTSPYWNQHTKENGTTYQGLTCPKCGDKSAWAYVESPMAICCNRLSQCGARVKTTQIFPEVRTNVERDFPPTKADPHRPARQYLLARGFSASILEGLEFRYLRNARNSGSGAVLFLIGKDEKGKEIWNGRLFNPPSGEGKSHNLGSTSGRYWQHPGVAYDPEKRTWVVESITDCLSLLQLGEQAVAALSAGQDPGKVPLGDFKNLVLAFDNDPAGHRACRKWRMAHPNAEIILCDPGEDWNDLISSGSLIEARKTFNDNLPRYTLNGKLAIAETARQYADYWNKFYESPPGLFTFNGSTFFSEKKVPRGGDVKDAFVAVSRCFKGTLRVISFILNKTNPLRPEYLYHIEMSPAKGKAIETIATGPDLASPRKMKEWFLTFVKINFEGDAKACTAIASMIAEDKKAPEVRQLPVVGYQHDSHEYVFAKWAVDTSGKLLMADNRGIFKSGYNQFFRPPTHAEDKAILPVGISKERVKEIFQLIGTAWGSNGLAALSWVVAGWFVDRVKAAISFFPLLSVFGDPASGKSALVTILNAIQGRDTEGLPITQLNTKKGLTRSIGQLSGLFTSLLEDSARNEKGFDYSILLTAYNRGPLQIQASFSSDLRTNEAPFLGSLLFCQNLEPFNSKQEKQRVISLHFRSDQLTDQSRAAYEKIIAIDKRELAGVLLQVLTNRQHFTGWNKEYEQAIVDLSPMAERRILQNHALILAFYRLFCSFFDIPKEEAITSFFAKIGREKCITSAIRQTTLADHFFELLDTVDESRLVDAYHLDQAKGHIYLNLPRAENLIRNKGVNLQVNESLNTALQKHPAFIMNSYRFRFPNDPEKDESGRPKQRRVWVFSLEWFLKSGAEHPDLPPQSSVPSA